MDYFSLNWIELTGCSMVKVGMIRVHRVGWKGGLDRKGAWVDVHDVILNDFCVFKSVCFLTICLS